MEIYPNQSVASDIIDFRTLRKPLGQCSLKQKYSVLIIFI
jgi:hypothetical protein